MADANDADRPWEQPSEFRRDCAPHRGPQLWWLGFGGLACGVLSFGLAVTVAVGLPLGIAVVTLAERDLVRMRKGVMDPT